MIWIYSVENSRIFEGDIGNWYKLKISKPYVCMYAIVNPLESWPKKGGTSTYLDHPGPSLWTLRFSTFWITCASTTRTGSEQLSDLGKSHEIWRFIARKSSTNQMLAGFSRHGWLPEGIVNMTCDFVALTVALSHPECCMRRWLALGLGQFKLNPTPKSSLLK